MDYIIDDRIDVGPFPIGKKKCESFDYDLKSFLEDEAKGVYASCHKLNAWLDEAFEDGPLSTRSLEELEAMRGDLTDRNGAVDHYHCTWAEGAKNVVTSAAAVRATSGAIPNYISECINKCLALRKEGLVLYKKTLALVLDCIKEVERSEEQRQQQEELEREQVFQQRQAARYERLNEERERHIQYQQQLLNWNHSKPSAQHQGHLKHSAGHIYILKNQVMPGIFKIGFTTIEPAKRAYEITAEMKMPVPFEVAHSWQTKEPFAVEQAIFGEIESHCQGREFYTGELDYLAVVCESKLLK